MKEAWSKSSLLVKIIIIFVAAIVLWVIYKKISAFIKLRKDQFLLNNSTSTTTVNGVPISINLGTIATQINDAFYNNDWFGWTEDEDLAVSTISNVPKQLIPDLTDIYFNLYKRNLNSDFVKFLSADSYKKVQNLFN
jgi:hypothetical protein